MLVLASSNTGRGQKARAHADWHLLEETGWMSCVRGLLHGVSGGVLLVQKMCHGTGCCQSSSWCVGIHVGLS